MTLAGCRTHEAAMAYARDEGCDPDDVEVRKMQRFQFRVWGCGSVHNYACRRGHCSRSAKPRFQSDVRSSQVPDAITSTQGVNGEQVLSTRLIQTDVLTVFAHARPEVTLEHIALSFRFRQLRGKTDAASGCDLRLVVNGTRVEIGAPAEAELEQASENAEGTRWRAELKMETAEAIAASSASAFRVCGIEWRVAANAREQLALLIERARAQAVWNAEPAPTAGGEATPRP